MTELPYCQLGMLTPSLALSASPWNRETLQQVPHPFLQQGHPQNLSANWKSNRTYPTIYRPSKVM